MFHPDGTTPPYDHDEFRQELWVEPWEGQVLASQITPFEIRVPDEEGGPDRWITGRLTHEVIREAETSYLSFHYRVRRTGAGGGVTDFEGLSIDGFGSYFTDFRSDVQDVEEFALRREHSGDRFSYWVDRFGHTIVVRTDAPDFAEGGWFRYTVDFEPSGDAGTATIGTFRAVPEPAAPATAVLIGAAALLRRRRPAATAPPPGAGR